MTYRFLLLFCSTVTCSQEYVSAIELLKELGFEPAAAGVDKAYTQAIPGTDLEFEMLPIPSAVT